MTCLSVSDEMNLTLTIVTENDALKSFPRKIYSETLASVPIDDDCDSFLQLLALSSMATRNSH